MRTQIVLAGFVLAAMILIAPGSVSAGPWQDTTGERDMPWLGNGTRARFYERDTWCLGCPTGSRHEQHWGKRFLGGGSPYDTVYRAFSFLDKAGVLAQWPDSKTAGSVGGATGTIETRTSPYVFTVVMLEPTIVLMRFDLGALAHVVPQPEHYLLTPFYDQPIEYGTRIPATGSLSWFSPDARQTPTPVVLDGPDRGTITIKGVQLVLTRHGDDWITTVE